MNEKIWNVGAEVFIPAVEARLVTQAQVDSMIAVGWLFLVVPMCLLQMQIFFGVTGEYTDEKVSVLPDFIANCGMARVFAYLMQANIKMTDSAIFADTSATIGDALKKSYAANNSKTNIAKTAFEITESIDIIMDLQTLLQQVYFQKQKISWFFGMLLLIGV